MHRTIECRLLTDTAELEALAPQWSALWRLDPKATPFQSPEWLLPWSRQFGSPDLRLQTLWRGGELAGILPFYVYREPQTGERQMLLIGAGTSDYLDGVFSPACTEEDVVQALDRLYRQPGWDALHAAQLRPGSLLDRALARLGARGTPGEFCSHMAAVPLAGLPQKIRRNAMYYRNRAARQGVLTLEFADETNWQDAFQALVRLHTERWVSAGEPGVLADPRVLAWHRESLPKLARAGLLRLAVLRLEGEILGVLYSLIDSEGRADRTQFFYLTAYSTRHAELRPGTLLLAFAVERAAGEGVATIDMLRGEEEYKKIWHLERAPTRGRSLRCGDPAMAKAVEEGSVVRPARFELAT